MTESEPLNDDEFARLVERAIALPDAPAHVIKQAILLWPTSQRTRPDGVVAGALKALRALLTFDSWATAPLAMGQRGGSSSTRHLLFSAEGRDIDLRIVPTGHDYGIVGQVLGPDESGTMEWRVVADSVSPIAARTASLDDFGEFRLDGMARGTYLVTLRFPAASVELPPIDVGERPGSSAGT